MQQSTPACAPAPRRVRDGTLVELGIRLEDRPDGSSVWKPDDPAVLRAEQVGAGCPVAAWALQARVSWLHAGEGAAWVPGCCGAWGAWVLPSAEAEPATGQRSFGPTYSTSFTSRVPPTPQEERRRAAAEARCKKLRTQLENKRKVG